MPIGWRKGCEWGGWGHGRTRTDTDFHGRAPPIPAVRASPCRSVLVRVLPTSPHLPSRPRPSGRFRNSFAPRPAPNLLSKGGGTLANPLFARKPLSVLLEEVKGENRLRRVLGPVQLTSLGIGAVIGTGIFVTTGAVARETA